MLTTLPTPVPVRALRLFLQFFTLVDAHCELTYLELRPLVFLKGQLCRLLLFRTLPAGARRTRFLPLLHRLRPHQQRYLQDYPEDPILKKINLTIGPKSFSITLKMVNLEAKNINIVINIILVMILVDIGQYWFQILIMILIVILIMI